MGILLVDGYFTCKFVARWHFVCLTIIGLVAVVNKSKDYLFQCNRTVWLIGKLAAIDLQKEGPSLPACMGYRGTPVSLFRCRCERKQHSW